MEFRTKIPLSISERQINYSSKIVALGSCFAENMGGKFSYFKFDSSLNPFGILFHPVAIEKVISSALSETEYKSEDIFFHNNRWHCYDAHSDLSHPEKDSVLKNLNKVAYGIRKDLTAATHCIITLGTAWVYRHKKSNQLVANCHKVPQKEFDKELLSVEEISTSLSRIVEIIQKPNPGVEIIFTVSPVRHIKDGFIENQRSKAHLITAIHSVLNTGTVSYFPSYEILMDELRDYRFYAEDMIHPNQTAIDYIWQRFTEAWISEQAVGTMKEVEGVQKAISHKPFDPHGKAHKEFLANIREKMDSLKNRFPHMDFNEGI